MGDRPQNLGAMSKRVFNIETCQACVGEARNIAYTKGTELIKEILTHIDAKGTLPRTPQRLNLH